MRKKIKMHFLLIGVFRKNMFVCISMGNEPVEGAITCNVKHKRFITQKRTLIFFSDFCRKCQATIPYLTK